MLVKVCGITDAGQINALAALGVGMAGMVFYPPSPRYAGRNAELKTPAHSARAIIRVGVFVDEAMSFVKTLAQDFGLKAIQLHGIESPEYCDALRAHFIVIKAFGVHAAFDFEALERYKGKVDYFLFDTYTDHKGGSGQLFDWQMLKRYRMKIPFLLSGGIGTESLPALRTFCHPYMAGIDLNSRVETRPGIKDLNKIKQIINEIRK